MARMIHSALLWFRAFFEERAAAADSERGDVPGWVMVTLMSALLIAGIYAVAGQALTDLFSDAISRVGGLR